MDFVRYSAVVNVLSGSIVSGSGSTGQYLIQLSHLIGLRVICTASMSNYESLRALGADVVLDRHTPDDEKVAQIREATQQTVSADHTHSAENVGCLLCSGQRWLPHCAALSPGIRQRW